MSNRTFITGDKSEEIYSKIFHISSSMLSLSTVKDGKFILVNDAFLTTLGYSREEVIGHTSLRLGIFADPDGRARLLKALEQNGQVRNIEIRIRGKDNVIRDAIFSADKITIDGENCWLIEATDITGRKRMEDLLRLSLKEKENLIREVHHRVKNNMQIISSLLQLQSEQFTNEATCRLFNEAKDRIRSMALVHEKLYNTKDLETVDFAAYANDLVINLFRSYGMDKTRIHFRLEANDRVKLGIDDAIPVALMLNELISNSLKHAFPDGRKGEIFLRIEENQGKVRIELSDNGIGMPEGVQVNNTKTLGLKLIQTLVEQLNATMELARRGGTRFVLSFTKKNN